MHPQGLQFYWSIDLIDAVGPPISLGVEGPSLTDVSNSQVAAWSWQVIIRALGQVGTYSCNTCSHLVAGCCIGGQAQMTKSGFGAFTRRMMENRCVSYLSFIHHLVFIYPSLIFSYTWSDHTFALVSTWMIGLWLHMRRGSEIPSHLLFHSRGMLQDCRGDQDLLWWNQGIACIQTYLWSSMGH